jgi:hypothetical protein
VFNINSMMCVYILYIAEADNPAAVISDVPHVKSYKLPKNKEKHIGNKTCNRMLKI